MSVYLRLHDFNHHYANLPFRPIMLNDVPSRTKEEKEKLHNLIISTYTNADTLSSIPSCSCGTVSFNYRIDELCPRCGTRVEFSAEKKIESTVWFRAPEGIVSLVSPIVWMMLKDQMSRSYYNVLLWFCNPLERFPDSSNRGANILIERLLKLEIPRGLNSFITNFDAIMSVVSSLTADVQTRQSMEQLIAEYRHCLFPQVLPIPSKVAFVLENTSTGTYADDVPAVKEVIDACLTIASLSRDVRIKLPRLESKVAMVLDGLSEYYNYMFGDPFSSKEGWFRKTVYASRAAFAYRSVVTSNAGVHSYKQIQIPYTQAFTVFRIHLMNKLYKQGYVNSEKEAFAYLMANNTKKDPLLLKLLQEVFDESEGGLGVPTLLIRYPVLERAGIQCFRINGVNDTTITLSVLCVKGPNADLVINDIFDKKLAA